MEVVLSADQMAIEEVKLGKVRGEVSKNVPVVPKHTVKIKSKVEVIKEEQKSPEAAKIPVPVFIQPGVENSQEIV